MTFKLPSRLLSASVLLLAFAGTALAQRSALPQLSSREGSAYTLYLNFGGFAFEGSWGNTGRTPGDVAAYSTDGDSSTFTSGELGNIRQVWARVAEKYSGFDVNVTTIDPAVAAGRAGSDGDRQRYYDATPRVMQSIIGGSSDWYGPAGGVSYVGTTQFGGYGGQGFHTNWTFANSSSSNNLRYLAEATAHEHAHGLSCRHQTDQNTGATYSSNGNSTGNGSFAPIMGNSYSSQRGLWREGRSGAGSQNDVQTLLSNQNIGSLLDDGIGHGFDDATPLALMGSEVDFSQAKGVIVPTNGGLSGALGVGNYTSDFFSFSTLGGAVTLTSNDGSQYLTAGVADPGATLDSELTIFDAQGNFVGEGITSASTLSDTFSGVLAAGSYYARVSSIGGYQSTYESDAKYFTMGSYFLTGSGFTPVPEPATFLALAAGVAAMGARRRKRKSTI